MMVSGRLSSPCAPAEALRTLCAGKPMHFHHFFCGGVLGMHFLLLQGLSLGWCGCPSPGRSCRAKVCSKCHHVSLPSPTPCQALPLSHFMAPPVITAPFQNHTTHNSCSHRRKNSTRQGSTYKSNHFIEFLLL